MNLADVVQRASDPPVRTNAGRGAVRAVERAGAGKAGVRPVPGEDTWESSAVVEGVLGRLNALAQSLEESFAVSVRQTGARLAASGGPAGMRLFASFEETVAGLSEADPELMGDYLALIHTILEKGDREALGGFLARAHEAVRSRAGSEKLNEVFYRAMDRLAARVAVEVRVRLSGEGEAQEADPLVLDLEGDGVNLTGAANGVVFDIDGDGRKEKTSFVQGDDAFLALDRNGNGRIDSGKELFGNQHGAAHGFAELARFDGNGDGRIDRSDEVYGRLRLFQDRNGNGVQEGGELRGLEDAGVEAIELGYEEVNRRTGSGDRVTQQGAFVRAGGGRGAAVDAMVGFLDVRV